MPASTLDLSVLAELKDTAGAEFVHELVATFLEEAPAMLAELRSAHAAQNTDVFRRTAHSLKSNSHTFGAMHLGELARALELGGLPNASAAALDAVESEFAKVQAALQDQCSD
jgi:HPt (histidine-containing phosphotransfer) domain-containing protein